jgi:membrane-bound metal-dependent hydrolase YbcI (DUF457 family)
MALCLAHATAGYLAYEALRPAGPHRPALLAGAVLMANAPDLDFLPGILVGAPAAYHRGVTHTVGALVVVSVAAWAVARILRSRTAWWWGLGAAAAYGSHLLVDWMTVDAVPPSGIRMLWPLTDAWLHAPFNLFGEIIIDPSGRAAFLRSLVTPAALLVWARELGIAIAAVAAVHALRGLHGNLTAPVADESLEP